jgi:hypothetical protein
VVVERLIFWAWASFFLRVCQLQSGGPKNASGTGLLDVAASRYRLDGLLLQSYLIKEVGRSIIQALLYVAFIEYAKGN